MTFSISNDLVDATSSFIDWARLLINTPVDGTPVDPGLDPEGYAKVTWGASGIFWGPPSTAKTARIRQLELAGLPVFTVAGGTLRPDSTEALMLPGPQGFQWVPSDLAMQQAAQHPHSVLFLDEISLVPPTVQNALLGVVQHRYVGSLPLPRGCRILMAANPLGTNQGARQLNSAFANRCVHLHIKTLPHKEFQQNALGNKPTINFSAAADAKLVIDRYPAAVAKHRTLMLAFTERNSTAYYAEPALDDPSSGFAWPSPRSWELAWRVSATNDALQLGLAHEIVQACCGKSAAEAYADWVRQQNIPDATRLLDGLETWQPHRGKVDISFIVNQTMTEILLDRVKRATTPAQKTALEQEAGRYWQTAADILAAGQGDIIRENAGKIGAAGWGAIHPSAVVNSVARQVVLALGIM